MTESHTPPATNGGVASDDDSVAQGQLESALSGRDLLDTVDRLDSMMDAVRDQVEQVIVGQAAVIEEILIALLAGGHVLLEGVPGLAKTLLVRTLASTLSLDFGRIQFTPDLMPADITGSQVLTQHRGGQSRGLAFQAGPLFVNLLLADEINRTPPKTQAALLEAMAERQVTTGGRRRPLPPPFFVLATQNSIDQEGTYPLPEAQLDRFLLKVAVDYPSYDEEELILRRTTSDASASAGQVLSREHVLALQSIVSSLTVAPNVLHYATRLARASRPEAPECPLHLRPAIAWGAGPRAGQSLVVAAKARTLLRGRFAVTWGDVRAVAVPVLRHRIIPSFEAQGRGLDADRIVRSLIDQVSPFSEGSAHDGALRKILRR